MPTHDIIVVGASAGGVEALSTLVGGLPTDLPAAVFVVLHLPQNGTSALPQILSHAGALPATHPVNGQAIQDGCIYVAPPDHHLLVRKGRLELSRGPRENRCRPAIDPLFRSAAVAYGRRVVSVVLSGTLDDGTADLLEIKQRGGIAMVQDPETALFSGMPRGAIEHVAVDRVLPVGEIGPLLARLAREPVAVAAGAPPATPEMQEAEELMELDPAAMTSDERPGTPSVFACPECGGTLWELQEGELVRYQCRIGHAFSAEGLLAAQSDALEDALWAALRALKEKVTLSRRLRSRAEERGHERLAVRFAHEMEEVQRRADVIRDLLLDGAGATPVLTGTPRASERRSALTPQGDYSELRCD